MYTSQEVGLPGLSLTKVVHICLSQKTGLTHISEQLRIPKDVSSYALYRSGLISTCRERGPPTFLDWSSCRSPQVGRHLVIPSSRLLLTLTLTFALGANALHVSSLLLLGGVGQRMLHQLVLQQALSSALQAQTILLATPAHHADRVLVIGPAGSSAQLDGHSCGCCMLEDHVQAPAQAQVVLLPPPARQRAASLREWCHGGADHPASAACTAASCQLASVVACQRRPSCSCLHSSSLPAYVCGGLSAQAVLLLSCEVPP